MEKNSVSKKNRQVIDSYDYLGNSASANDCTGLIPSAPQSEAELQSYEDVYAFPLLKVKGRKRNKRILTKKHFAEDTANGFLFDTILYNMLK